MQTLGISNLIPPVGAPVPEVSGELGAAGTPIFGGFLRELGEYNPNFSGGPFASFLLYEQMRRSDAMVAAVLSACKLPIRAAEWAISDPKDPTPEERLATDFVKENLFRRCDFKAALENALLMLDFGCAVHEDVYARDRGRICLARMAPRLPLTFYRWLTRPETDELIGLAQIGYRGGEYVNAVMPVEKIARFTFQQEGANFAGRSMLRAMYQHWYTKQALYAIAAIAAERNGMGIPVVTMGPKAKLEDRKAALAWVSSLLTHEKTGLVLPAEWTVDLQGVTGQTLDPQALIEHHNGQIGAVALAQFIMMGTGHHDSGGNRSLAETMSDFFFQGLQATADQIGEVFSETTIARLVKFNFGPGVRPPRLVPQDLIASKIGTIGTILSDLTGEQGGLITPDRNLEAWLRAKLGAPPVKDANPGIGDDPEVASASAVVTRMGRPRTRRGRA